MTKNAAVKFGYFDGDPIRIGTKTLKYTYNK